MKLTWTVVLVTILIVAGVALYPQGRTARETEMPAAAAFRILLGVGDTETTQWDGSVSVTPGAIASIQGWRFRPTDSTDSRATWKAWSGHSLIMIGRQNAGQAPPMMENGVIVAATEPAARLAIKTKQGDFTFEVKEIPFGVQKKFLNGKVVVDRVPDTRKLTDSQEDEDFPAIAQDNEAVWMTYVTFTRGDRSQHRWGQLGDDAPKSMDFVARPTGGDQVFLMRFHKDKRAWSAPIAVSAPHADVMRTAVAVDGKKRTWVIWSENRKGNFDLYAKSYAGGRWSNELRLTTNDGTDINPVAATDASGRVWVAWQAYRNGNLEILAAAQNGDKFTPETLVSFSKMSDWDPSIAAAPNGEVAIAWDTYDKGDYDVYFRRANLNGNSIRLDQPIPVAATQDFEARSSIAYDRQNRLWVAYEWSEAKWGKDTGPYDREGVPLYREHNARVKVYQGANVFEPDSAGLKRVLPTAARPAPALKKQGKQGKQAKQAKQSVDEHDTAGPRPGQMSLNSFPRIAVDSTGNVYMTFRTRSLPGRTPEGTVWVERLVYYDGRNWTGPIAVPNADQWIDNRPAMLATQPGSLMMALASDHRQSETLQDRREGRQTTIPDYINADLYAAEMRIPSAAQAQLTPVPAAAVADQDPETKPERDQIARMHDRRAPVGSDQLQVMRGEFHRHTDLSVDGNGDGPLIDAYRYMIDAAAMDWGGCCDHDNGTGEYPWWLQQKLTDAYKLGDRYVAMFSYERSVSYPEGHRNTIFAQRGIRPLPRLKKMANDSEGHAPDTQMLYEYLKKYDGIVASHTSGTDMGTDWRDNDPKLEPVVEIYQGCRQNYEMPGAPRTNTEDYSIGGWRPLGFVSLALKKGYRLAFQASSDHGSTHISYCNLWVRERTRAGILEAFHKRRVYGATDNILADVRSGSHFMGEEFTTTEAPSIAVKLTGTQDFAKVHIIRNGEYVYSIEPKKREVDFVWKDGSPERGKTSYYYVRGEQTDGELVWVSPMWITVK